MKIIDHNHKLYRQKWEKAGLNKYNGAFYYSKEIVAHIIPKVKTDRSWITVNLPGVGVDHSIFFVHNNLHPEHYDWIREKGLKDVVLVCGIPETVDKVKHLGRAVYLPLSIDRAYIQQFKVDKKTRSAAFVGRPAKRAGIKLPEGIDILEGLPRPKLLAAMAQYETVYAVGRTALEAKALGCKLKAYDPRFPKVSRWKVLDNSAAADMLQAILDEIDGKCAAATE